MYLSINDILDLVCKDLSYSKKLNLINQIHSLKYKFDHKKERKFYKYKYQQIKSYLKMLRIRETIVVEPNQTKEVQATNKLGQNVVLIFKNQYDTAFTFTAGEYEHEYLFEKSDEVYTLGQNGGKIHLKN